MKKFLGNYNDFQKMTHNDLLEMIKTMSQEEKEDLENNYIANNGMSFFGVKNYIAHKYFPRIFQPPREPVPSFAERLEQILTDEVN